MATKKANHEGSIYKQENGKWRVQVTLEGRRLGRVFNTQRESREWLKKTLGEIENGLTFDGTKVTLAEHLQSWLTSTKTSKGRSTWAHYEQIIRTYIVPHLGMVKVKDLRPEQIQAFYNKLYDDEVGVHTIRKLHLTLHCSLEQAVRTGMLGRNPSSFAQPPKEPAQEMATLNESQVSQLLVTAQRHRWEALFHLAIITGMRQMELLGLKWTDLDWLIQKLKIERQLLRPARGHGIEFSAPKTRFGRRSIALGSKTIDVLRKHYERQQTERLKAGDKWQEHGLVFTNKLGGPIYFRNLLRDFKKLLLDAGLPPIRFHDLRHTAASLLLNQGIPVIVVSRRLGHAKASITFDVYGHLIPSMQEEAAETIDNLVMPIPVEMTTPEKILPRR